MTDSLSQHTCSTIEKKKRMLDNSVTLFFADSFMLRSTQRKKRHRSFVKCIKRRTVSHWTCTLSFTLSITILYKKTISSRFTTSRSMYMNIISFRTVVVDFVGRTVERIHSRTSIYLYNNQCPEDTVRYMSSFVHMSHLHHCLEWWDRLEYIHAGINNKWSAMIRRKLPTCFEIQWASWCWARSIC